jgi:aldose 1-epimerase
MTVLTTQPSVQVYTANFLPPPTAEAPHPEPFRQHWAVCLETQHPPDAVHHPHFPSIEIKGGEAWTHTTVHQLEWS